MEQAKLVRYRLGHDVSAVMTLEPGELLLTGTPAGVGPLLPGDRVVVEIEGIGTLENEVAYRG
jgi:2-keto-4-pentenoate hydratase/2-oxohepta-3-ene-1,7-dioic acid hydratase in catechol pathway